MGEKIHLSEKNKTPIQLIIGSNDVKNETLALNIYNEENIKDVKISEALDIIQEQLKEPIFDINGWWN